MDRCTHSPWQTQTDTWHDNSIPFASCAAAKASSSILKGSRCESPKCAIERRNAAPGMHGYRRGKPSEYGVRLREKQKLKRFYGVLERQFRRYFELASRSPENTGEVLLSIMERRLDNVVHRLGFAPNRGPAPASWWRTATSLLNGQACDIPSMLLKAGDTRRGQEPAARACSWSSSTCRTTRRRSPDFLERTGAEPPEGRVTRLPTRGDVDPRIQDIREQLIIEVCSRVTV